MTLHATNVGTARAPFGAGLHPYLTPGDARGSTTWCSRSPRARTCPSTSVCCRPARPTPVDGTELDFRRARRLGALRVDTCFGDLGRSPAGVARVRLAHQRRRAASSRSGWTSASASSRSSPRDAAIAVEPMTCAPDAFNSGDGLVVLEPGASFTGRCGLIAAGF